jgi:hypothetical protein
LLQDTRNDGVVFEAAADRILRVFDVYELVDRA